MTQIEISKIKVEDRIRKTFNNIEELAVEIDELGLINPITITKDFKLLAGERRLRAHKHLGRTHIEVNIVDTDDEETQLLIEIKENESRESFTFSERMDYARRLERIEREKAVQRMSEGGKGVQNFAHVKTREVVAEQVGFGSGEQYRKAKYVEANATDEVIEKLDMGEMSVHAAWKETKARLEQQVTDAETRAEQAEQRLLDAERSEEILTRQNERLTDELSSVTKPETVVVEKEVERIVEVDKTDYSAVKRLQAYEKRFGALENYSDRVRATNVSDATTAIVSFNMAVRDFRTGESGGFRGGKGIPNLDTLEGSSANERLAKMA